MASITQIAANRRNSGSSTGPKSAEGKARSSQNSLTHGLTAQKWLLADEDPVLFEVLWQEADAYFEPRGLEVEVVERVVGLLWRLRRAAGFEALLLNAKTEAEAHDPTRKLKLLADQPEARPIAGALESILHDDLLNRLGRYERNFHNQLIATLKQLKEMQETRMNAPISLPDADTAQPVLPQA